MASIEELKEFLKRIGLEEDLLEKILADDEFRSRAEETGITDLKYLRFLMQDLNRHPRLVEVIQKEYSGILNLLAEELGPRFLGFLAALTYPLDLRIVAGSTTIEEEVQGKNWPGAAFRARLEALRNIWEKFSDEGLRVLAREGRDITDMIAVIDRFLPRGLILIRDGKEVKVSASTTLREDRLNRAWLEFLREAGRLPSMEEFLE